MMMPSSPGRPREFTLAKRQELVDHVHRGATVAEAAQIVGVSLRTVQLAAKRDDEFHHELELARHDAQVDPEQFMFRAARTHWRAAAWLLERTDPQRYGRRKANSCSPETLADMNDWLIETALEATPPEQRTAVYQRMRSVADQGYAVLMPDHQQQEAKRRLAASLPERPMPLLAHEWEKSLQVVRNDAPAVAPDADPSVPDSQPTAGAQRQEAAPAADERAQTSPQPSDRPAPASVDLPGRATPASSDAGQPSGPQAVPPEQGDYCAKNVTRARTTRQANHGANVPQERSKPVPHRAAHLATSTGSDRTTAGGATTSRTGSSAAPVPITV